jgi:hypothetical protein
MPVSVKISWAGRPHISGTAEIDNWGKSIELPERLAGHFLAAEVLQFPREFQLQFSPTGPVYEGVMTAVKNRFELTKRKSA